MWLCHWNYLVVLDELVVEDWSLVVLWCYQYVVRAFSQAVPKKVVCFNKSLFGIYWTRYEVFTSCYFIFFGTESTLYFFFFTNLSCVYCFYESFFRFESCDAVISTIKINISFILFPNQTSNSNSNMTSVWIIFLVCL